MNAVIVDRQRFRLELWEPRDGGDGYDRLRKLGIAVGAIGHATPRGVYQIVSKSTKPDWRAPNAEWVPADMRGKVYAIDSPHNPFEGGFISLLGPGGIQDGIGIHGTKFDPEIGTRASHGCIRVHTEDFLWLYERVGLGDTAVIF